VALINFEKVLANRHAKAAQYYNKHRVLTSKRRRIKFGTPGGGRKRLLVPDLSHATGYFIKNHRKIFPADHTKVSA
jgi:hypothetical protein